MQAKTKSNTLTEHCLTGGEVVDNGDDDQGLEGLHK
jgi:hypothetical protein